MFFVCRFVWLVWCLCFEWLCVLFVIHSDPVSNFIHFGMCNASSQVIEFWGAIWIGVVSEIWNHKNNVIFNRGKADVSKVLVMVQVKVWSWLYSKSRFRMFSFSNWCLDPVVCMRLTLWCFVHRVGFLSVLRLFYLVGYSCKEGRDEIFSYIRVESPLKCLIFINSCCQ